MTLEQFEKLKARRDEIITVAMGKCWHDNKDGYYCTKCGAYLLDEDSVDIIPNPTYSTPEGWFTLYNWLTKEHPELWEMFTKWFYRERTSFLDVFGKDVLNFNDNLPDLFVEWLAETETGWWEEREKA